MQFDSNRSIAQNLSALASFCRQPLSGIRRVYAGFGTVPTEHLELAHQQVVEERRPVGDTILRNVIDSAHSDPRLAHYIGLARVLFPWADFERIINQVIEDPTKLNDLSPQDAGTLAQLLETFTGNKLAYSPKLGVYEVDRNLGHNLDETLRGILTRYESETIETLISNLRAISTSN